MITHVIQQDVSLDGSIERVIHGGLDIGNSDTKASIAVPITGNKWVLVHFRIESRVESGSISKYRFNESLMNELIQIIDGKGNSYIVGSPTPMDTGTIVYQTSTSRGALGYAALEKAIEPYRNRNSKSGSNSDIGVKIGLTMMLDSYLTDEGKKNQANIAKVSEILSHNFSVRNGQQQLKFLPLHGNDLGIEVVGEGLAAVFDILRDHSGNKILQYDNGHQVSPGQQIALVDVGYQDTVIVIAGVTNNWTPTVLDKKTTQEISIKSNLCDTVEVEVGDLMRAHSRKSNSDLSLPSGKDLMGEKVYTTRIFDKDVDITSIKQSAVLRMTETLAAFISSKLKGNGNRLAGVFLVGGFPELAKSIVGQDFFYREDVAKLMNFNNLIIPQYPAFANSSGVLKTVLFRYGKQVK